MNSEFSNECDQDEYAMMAVDVRFDHRSLGQREFRIDPKYRDLVIDVLDTLEKDKEDLDTVVEKIRRDVLIMYVFEHYLDEVQGYVQEIKEISHA